MNDMTGQDKYGMQCAEFDALLTEAMDGRLGESQMSRFRAHADACADCRPLFELATTGMQWMRSLPEVEPPRNLVHNIIAATSGKEALEKKEQRAFAFGDRVKGFFRPVYAPFAQPRFAMSFGMAFFSVTLLLNLAGVRLSDVRNVDLRPGALQASVVRQYNDTAARVVKYYENIQFVYQLESKFRDLKNAALESDDEKQDAAPKDDKSDDKQKNQDDKKPKGKPAADDQGAPDQHKKQLYYSQEQAEIVIAMAEPPADQLAVDSKGMRTEQ